MKKICVALLGSGLMCLPVMAQGTGTAATSDQAFVELAGQTDMTEAHLGQMAAEQAGTQAIKDYAQMLVTDHTADYNALTAAATKASLTVPKGLDEKQMKMITPFDKLHERAFDHRFIHEMIVGHESAIAAYKKEISDGQNPDIKAYATQALPTLEKHETDAKGLLKAK